MQKLDEYLGKLGFLEYTRLPLVRKASAKIKVPESILVTVVLALGVLLMFTPYFSELLTTLVMFTIPSFETFRALKSKSTQDDEELLTYWIVFGCLYTFDSLFRYLLDFFGFYCILRMVMLGFIFYSRKFGSRFIYARAIRPFFERFGEQIDSLVRPLEQQGQRISRFIKVNQDELKKLNLTKDSMEDEKEKQD
jgi:hypothetical protein